MPISVGTQAPDFTLKSKNAEGLVDVKLSANFGTSKNMAIDCQYGAILFGKVVF